MPVVSRSLVNRIKENESNSDYLRKNPNKDQEVLGNTSNGTYVGLGRPEHVKKTYKEAGVTREMAKEAGLERLFNKELVVGYGHMLQGKSLKDYFTNPKRREYFDNLSEEDANELLHKDIIKHQKYTNNILEEYKIKPESLTRSQKNALDELTFQLGPKTFKTFKKFWGYAKDGDWENAAQELKYGKTRHDYSTLWGQAKHRVKRYMKDLVPTPESSLSEDAQFKVTPTDLSTVAIPESQGEPASAGIPRESYTNNNYDSPFEENQARLKDLGFTDNELSTMSAQKDRLRDLGFTSEELQEYNPETPKTDSPTMSQGEAFATGAVHGATLGTAQKLGGIGSMYQKGIERLMPETPDTADIMFGMGAGTMPSDLAAEAAEAEEPKHTVTKPQEAFKKEDFMEGQREYRKPLEAAQKQWKKTTMAGELAGGIFTGAIIPGSAALRGTSLTKKLGTAAKIGAAEGAVYRGSESMAENVQDLTKDMAIGSVEGAIGGAAFGALAHGGGFMWKKLKGKLKEGDAAKASLLADDAVDVVLTNAENRARSELDFNREMLKTIKGFGDKNKKDQLKFLDLKIKDAPKVLKEWASTVNPEALTQYAKNVPTKIPSRILKIAKKENLDPKVVHAYYNWRNDMFNYMKFINDVGGRASKSKKDLLDATREVSKVKGRSIIKEIPAFKKNLKAGLVNDESFNEFKLQQYLAEEIQKVEDIKVQAARVGYDTKDERLLKAVEEEAREQLQNDPMRNLLYKKMSTVSNAAELIDDRAGTKVLDTVQDLYVADKQKTGFTRAIADSMKLATKLRDKGKYAKMSNEEIIQMIESGAKDPLADAYRKVFRDIREYANQKGVRIDEYRLGQDQYVPMKRKGAAEMIESLELKAKELLDNKTPDDQSIKDMMNTPTSKALSDEEINKILQSKGNPLAKPDIDDVSDTTFAVKSSPSLAGDSAKEIPTLVKGKRNAEVDELVGKYDNKVAKEMAEKEPEYITDIRYMQDILGGIYGREIRNVEQMRRAIKQLRKKENIRALLKPSIRNVHERTGSLPMWARETDIGRMALLDADNIADLIYKRPVLNRLDTQIMMLKMKGFNNSADYLNNLKKDILGITRGGAQDTRQFVSTLKQLHLGKSKLGKAYLGIENAVMTALYPNYLGFNARALVRNLTQPYTMTTRELGMGLKGDVLALNATRKILREGLGKAQKRYAKLGLLDARDPSSADFEGLRSGMRNYFKRSKIARKMDRFIDGYSDAAMYLYGKTDTVNRLITAQMAEDIAKVVKSGNHKWLKKAPKQIQNKVRNQLEDGASVDEITQTIGKWLQVKTQLNYGKDDMYEFGREMGPLFAMLSKWPTAITSDIATMLMRDGKAGATRAAGKYLMPMVLVGLLQNGLDSQIDSDSAQSKAMFGYGGLNSWLPGQSVFGITDAVMPIPIESMFENMQGVYDLGNEAITGRWDSHDTKKLQKVLKKTSEQFMPVGGGIMRTKKHLEDLTGETDKKKKRKSKY